MKKYYRPRAQQKTVLLFKILRVIWNQPYRIGIYSEISINSFTFFHTTPACRPEQIFSRRGLFIKSLVESCSLGGGGRMRERKGWGGGSKRWAAEYRPLGFDLQAGDRDQATVRPETPTAAQPRARSARSTAGHPDCENFHRLPRNITKNCEIYRGQGGPQAGLPSVFHLTPPSEN